MKMLISVTSLSAYDYCSRKLWLERILRLKEPPKEPLILGKIRHQVVDFINKDEKNIVSAVSKDDSDDAIKERYHNHYLKQLKKAIADHRYELEEVGLNQLDAYKKIKELVLDESDIRASNLITFVRKNDIYGDELWERLTPKIESEFYIESEKLGLKGIIDNIEKYDDILIPIELKTGHAPREGAWDGHKLQLGAYLLMLSDKLGKDINKGYIRYLDIAENRSIVMNPFLRMKITDMVKKVNDCLASKELPDFCGSENKCKSCGLRERCYDPEFLKKEMKQAFKTE
jgi:CRISPR-associated protein Cas4